MFARAPRRSPFCIALRAELDEVMAFESQGDLYFRTGWDTNVVGLVLQDCTDWDEVAEVVVESYCVQGPAGPGRPG